MLTIISAGIAPGLALLSYFYLKDEYSYEPLTIVFKTFLLGALLVFPIMFFQYVINVELAIKSHFINAFIITSFLEEFFKWFIIFFTIYKHSAFDEPYDGIVYCTAVSLGFASAENIIYLFSNGIHIAFGRALLPVSSHALFGVMMGYYFGKGKFFLKTKKSSMIYSLMIPVLLHGTYDYILLSINNWLIYIVLFIIFLWFLALMKVRKAKILSTKIISETERYII